jgi:16S rRNA (guanine527-N7)-methyltransferase
MQKASEVSRETLDKYVELLLKWNKKINLISKNTEKDVWDRHILDSLQLTKYLDKEENVLDVGSGAGLPGIVLSIAGYNLKMIECDTRKMSFLREAVRICGLKAELIHDRIENVKAEGEVLVARGFASINDILKLTTDIRCDRYLLLKGKNTDIELAVANKEWNFDYKRYKSISADDSSIVEITNVQRKS